mmetsp:Transcript_33194/g.83974  ORF Transcript_33194/g.83974 Transcript_33194/m.83974 type:complete len:212 (-) Transcript_33194:40-675(-)
MSYASGSVTSMVGPHTHMTTAKESNKYGDFARLDGVGTHTYDVTPQDRGRNHAGVCSTRVTRCYGLNNNRHVLSFGPAEFGGSPRKEVDRRNERTTTGRMWFAEPAQPTSVEIIERGRAREIKASPRVSNPNRKHNFAPPAREWTKDQSHLLMAEKHCHTHGQHVHHAAGKKQGSASSYSGSTSASSKSSGCKTKAPPHMAAGARAARSPR